MDYIARTSAGDTEAEYCDQTEQHCVTSGILYSPKGVNGRSGFAEWPSSMLVACQISQRLALDSPCHLLVSLDLCHPRVQFRQWERIELGFELSMHEEGLYSPHWVDGLLARRRDCFGQRTRAVHGFQFKHKLCNATRE